MSRVPHRTFSCSLANMFPARGRVSRIPLFFALAGVAWVTGCSDDQTRLAPNEDTPVSELPAGRTADQLGGEFPSLWLLEPSISAVGPFQPGKRVRILASVKANRHASTEAYEVLSLDEHDNAMLRREPTKAIKLAQSFGGLARGGRRDLAATVTFAHPGYYRVMLRAAGTSSEPQSSGDTTIVNASSKQLWILVDEKGGHLTEGYDSTAIIGRTPKFGTSGPFVSEASLRTPSALAVAPYNYSGQVTYMEGTIPTPVADAQVTAGCGYQSQFGIVYTNQTVRTDANGNFAYTCAADRPLTWTNINMLNTYVFVKGRDGVFAGAHFSGSGGGVFNVRVVNDVAGHVWRTLSTQVPKAVVKFARSRSRIDVYVSPTSGYQIAYFPSSDHIQLSIERVYNEDGEFVSTHEYGHAFHWKAIEAPASYSCTDNSHSIGTPDLQSCAFVEGFADFFAIWVAGQQLTTGWSGGYATDNALEQNPWRTTGDGSRIEGPAAAFMYDLVDGASEPDGPSNTADGDEFFDTATYPGSYVLNIIGSCTLGPGISNLDGMDQFVYCAERSTSARPLGINWRLYASVSGPTPPAGWSADVVRRLWRYNFYNVAP